MIAALLNDRCTLVQRRPTGAIDRYGAQIFKDREVQIDRSHFQQVAGRVGANGVYYSGKGYLESGIDIRDDDQVIAMGKRFWVNSVQQHRSPIGEPTSYLSLELRETEERACMSQR